MAATTEPKKKKRGQNEGTIAKNEKTGLWCGRLTIGKNPDGTQKRKAFYGKTKAQVQKAMNETKAMLDNGTYVEPTTLTTAQWLDTWLAVYKKHTVKIKTYAGYEQMIRLYIKPSIGTVPLKKLQSAHLQQLYNEMKERGLSTSTIHQTHVAIHSALKQALTNGMITRNVSEVVQKPKTTQRQARALTVDERKKVLEALSDNKFGVAFLLDLYTGMRKGEVLALKWSDIHFDEGYITVRRTLDRVKNISGSGPRTIIVIDSPKSESGFRIIPLGENAIKLLRGHKAAQTEKRLRTGSAWADDDFVFTNEVGKHLEPRYFSKVFEDLKMQTGIEDMTIHTLRHTFATQGLEHGIDMKVMQKLLGHASYSTTANIYMHVDDSMKRKGIAQIEEGYTALKG